MCTAFRADDPMLDPWPNPHLDLPSSTTFWTPHRDVLQPFLAKECLFASSPDEFFAAVPALQRPVYEHETPHLSMIPRPASLHCSGRVTLPPGSTDYRFRPLRGVNLASALRVSGTLPQIVHTCKRDGGYRRRRQTEITPAQQMANNGLPDYYFKCSKQPVDYRRTICVCVSPWARRCGLRLARFVPDRSQRGRSSAAASLQGEEQCFAIL
jgi:hypothetical protein